MAYKVENSPIYYKTWATKGVREVRHLMKVKNSFLSLAEFREGCKIKINYLIFHGIVAAIKPKRKIFVGKKFHRIQMKMALLPSISFKVHKPNNLVHNKLIRSVSLKQTSPSGSQNKWIVDCNMEFQVSIHWNVVYETPFCCTKVSKLIVYQFKLLHRRLNGAK